MPARRLSPLLPFVVGNLGSRWVWGSGFTLAVRAGLGTTLGGLARAEDPEAAEDAGLPDGPNHLVIDTELSAGWAF